MQYALEQYRQMDRALFSDGSEREVFFKLLKEYGGTLSPEFQKSFKVGVDIGSVSGFYLAAFQGFGMKAIAVNSDARALLYLREDAIYSPYVESGQGKEVQLMNADMVYLPVENGSVDLMTVMTGTFSHVQKGRHESVLEEFSRVFGKGKFLIISDWNLAREGQDFFGLYNEEEQKRLRTNHLGYPHLLEALPKFDFTPRLTILHSQKKMYAVLSTRK